MPQNTVPLTRHIVEGVEEGQAGDREPPIKQPHNPSTGMSWNLNIDDRHDRAPPHSALRDHDQPFLSQRRETSAHLRWTDFETLLQVTPSRNPGPGFVRESSCQSTVPISGSSSMHCGSRSEPEEGKNARQPGGRTGRRNGHPFKRFGWSRQVGGLKKTQCNGSLHLSMNARNVVLPIHRLHVADEVHVSHSRRTAR
jgi:hypothetical protein